MKRFILYLLLIMSLTFCTNCNLKYKWHTNQKEKLQRKKQEQIHHILTSEHVILDSSFQFSHKQLKNYRLWTLSGNVQIYPNGSLQTDHASLESWYNEIDSQQAISSNTTYQNKSLEEESIVEEGTTLNKKSTQKEKRKFTTNLWWLVLLIIPLGLRGIRRRWL